MDKERLLRYCIQLGMLKTLFIKKLITENEYEAILKKLRNDYGVISEILT